MRCTDFIKITSSVHKNNLLCIKWRKKLSRWPKYSHKNGH